MYFINLFFGQQRCLVVTNNDTAEAKLVAVSKANAVYEARTRSSEEVIPFRIVAISDTHERHRSLGTTLPKGDVLVHCGDILNSDYDDEIAIRKLKDFNEWMGLHPHRHKIVVAGNHDAFLERIGKDRCKELLCKVTYLQNEMVELEHPIASARKVKLRVFATPFSWRSKNHRAFQPMRKEEGEAMGGPRPRVPMMLMVDNFPDAVIELMQTKDKQTRPFDVVVSHASRWTRVAKRRPLGAQIPIKTRQNVYVFNCRMAFVHLGGHSHQNFGPKLMDDTLTVNACSVKSRRDEIFNEPIVVDYTPNSRRLRSKL